MAYIILKNGKKIGDYLNPYLVAEVNTSHFGDLNIAKKMLDKLKEIGCDCAKFQSWSSESLYSKTYYKENPIAQRMVKKLQLAENSLLELAEYARSINLDFASTPYSKEEVKFLIDKCKVPFIKIASMDLNNTPFLDFIAKTSMPIVLSTGMSSFDEINNAVNVIEKAGNKKICILHCVSDYPSLKSSTNLNNIHSLRSSFKNYPIGYSDHTLGDEVSIASAAIGSAYIEKHFTLDNSKIGMDNQMAIMPTEFKKLVEKIRNVHSSLGSNDRILSNKEKSMIDKMRRSIVSSKNLKKGHTLSIEDIDTKRPATGLSPINYNKIIGKKIMRDIDKDNIIFQEDIQDF